MMEKVYSRPSGIFDGAVTGFCPGCLHSSASKIVCEVLDELGMVDNSCYVQGVGCGGLVVTYFDIDTVAAPHGRACAVASSFKRCSPETLVFTRATATWPLSAWRRRCPPPTAARTSPLFS